MPMLLSTPSEGQREVIAKIRDDGIRASIAEMRAHDRMTVALRSALQCGMDINTLSEASGLPIDEIRRRVDAALLIDTDLPDLVGTR